MLRELCDAIWNTYGQPHDKDIPKLSYVNLSKGKEYPIEIRDSYVGMFELL